MAEKTRKGADSENQHLSPFAYSLISLIAFVIGIFILFLFVFKAEELMANGIDSIVFYVLLLPLGLSAAAFLFGTMRSFAVIRGKKGNWKVELRGPVVVFVLVVAGGLELIPTPPDTFDMTVFVHGTKGKHDIVPKEGEVMIDLDGNRRTEKIGEKGNAYFPGIPAKFLNQSVPVSVIFREMKFYEQNINLSKKPIYVKVEKIDTTVFLHGSGHKQNAINGTLTIDLGESWKTEKIGERGEVHFIIPEEFRDQKVSIALDAEGFELVNPEREYFLNGKNIYAEIKRNVHTTTTITRPVPTTTTPITRPVPTTTTTVRKTEYKVDLIIPSDMIGAEILVDGKPAKIYKKTLSIIIIIVEEKDSPHAITIKKGKDSCTATQMINEDNLQIIPCQDR